MTSDPTAYPDDRPRAATIRSRVMLEVASELVGSNAWAFKQSRIDLRSQGSESWQVSLFGSDGVDGVEAVVNRRADFAILNPAAALFRAHESLGGTDLVALSPIATIPSYDQLGFAVSEEYGVATLEELVVVKPPIQVSLRSERPNHAVHMVIGDVLRAAGTSLREIQTWGGAVRYDRGIPHESPRVDAILDGSVSAVFDEGIYNWVDIASGAGLRFLSIGDETLAKVREMGYRAGIIARDRYRTLDADIPTVDFSGFCIFTRSDLPDDVVEAFCEALVARQHSIPWQGGSSLPLAQMCIDAIDAPIPLPLHPAAEAFWRRCGYLLSTTTG